MATANHKKCACKTEEKESNHKKKALRKLLFEWLERSAWLKQNQSLLLTYFDFAFDENMSDAVRFRSLERISDFLDRAASECECPAEQPDKNQGQSRRLVEQWVGERLGEQGAKVAGPLLHAFLDLAFSGDVSETVRLRALEKILGIVEKSQSEHMDRDQSMPDEIEKSIQRIESFLRGSAPIPAGGVEAS